MPSKGKASSRKSKRNDSFGSALLHSCLRQQAESSKRHHELIESLKAQRCVVGEDDTCGEKPSPAGVAFGGNISRYRTLEFITRSIGDHNPAKGSVYRKNAEQHLRSVIEQSGLDEYLSSVLAAQDSFSADRYEARLLQTEPSPEIVSCSHFGTKGRSNISQGPLDIPIPRRPIHFLGNPCHHGIKSDENEAHIKARSGGQSMRRRHRARVRLLLSGKMEEATVQNVQFVRDQRDKLHRKWQKPRPQKGRDLHSHDDHVEVESRSSSKEEGDGPRIEGAAASGGGTDSDCEQDSLSDSGVSVKSDDTTDEQSTHKHLGKCAFPKSAAELDEVELGSFLEWRRSLAQLEEECGVVLTPYERNIEVWRQLWRVIERSDLVLQIVDGRDPAFFRSADLEKYVREVSTKKKTILLINKADLLPPEVRNQWALHFLNEGVEVYFFSALRELCQQERKQGHGEESGFVSGDHGTVESKHLHDSSLGHSKCFEQDSTEWSDHSDGKSLEETHGGSCYTHEALGSGSLLGRWASTGADENVLTTEDLLRLLEEKRDAFKSVYATDCGGENAGIGDGTVDSSGKISETMSRDFVVGMVGYPNVGKSSLINALLGFKKVSVSHQPGKTRRLQTLQLKGKGITLCDCPGLVMPKAVGSKHNLVLNGVVPVDEMRGDYLPSVQFICEWIPHSLLNHYGVSIEAYRQALSSCAFSSSLTSKYAAGVPRWNVTAAASDDTLEARPLLVCIALQRHFVTGGKGGQPDLYRVAKMILRDFTSGSLVRCHLPGGTVFGQPEEQRMCSAFLAKVRSSGGTGDAVVGGITDEAASPRNNVLEKEKLDPLELLQQLEEDTDLLEAVEVGSSQNVQSTGAPIVMTKRKCRQMQKALMKGKGKATSVMSGRP